MDFTVLIIIIVIALLFDLVNGFHDAANSIATVVSTKVLTPGQAVIWAAFFNVVAFWVFDMSVGNTVAKTVDNGAIDLWVILAGLLAATIWNLLTWWLGIPSSSSHTLIGGFAGAAIAHAGFDVVNSSEIYKVIGFIFLAPIIGGVIAYIFTLITIIRNGFKKVGVMVLITLAVLYLMQYMVEYMDVKPIMMWIVAVMMGIMILTYIWYFAVHGKTQTAMKESNMYKKLQLLSSAAFSLGHGGADSQKVMGIICAACMVFANISREEGKEKSIPEFLTVSEVMQIEFTSPEGKKEKFKPEHANGDKLYVYAKGDGIYDADSKELIFDDKKINPSYTDAAQFSDYVENGKLKEGHKIKTKVHSDSMPWWIAFSCYLMIGLGTLMGGWKIVKTMGTKITKVTPLEGVCAETAGALTLFTVSNMGIPVSTTHTITGSIIGVGATKRLSAVRWGVTISLLWAWILTIPVSALIASLIYYIMKLFV
ncbi:inorganic phosphate transporter [Flavobacterium enshiense]|uniref:inorganic phosphate transporter n=1 Tax=Flavobacterium enshiense TaxID=1341165 RepID=UPI00345D23F2